MNSFFSLLGSFVFLATSVSAQIQPHPLSVVEKQQLVQSHNTAFQALNETIRDPYVMKGPDGFYYLTGTTAGSYWGETVGIHLWRSSDLVSWQDMGFVWDLYKDVPNKDSWHFKQPIKHFNSNNKRKVLNPLAIWAPEIHYLNGTWWIPHSLNISGHGLLKSTSGKPEGPYEVVPPIATTGIDPHLYQEKGQTYYMWGAERLALMTPDMIELAEEPVDLQLKGKHPMGYEGILMLKFGDHYVHIASGRYGYEPTNTYDLYYGVSKQIQGPYGPRRMAIKNAGHGNLFQGPNGQWWATAFDHEYYNHNTMKKWSLWLVPIDIHITPDDVVFDVKDDRFKPNSDDQDTVKKLAESGIPERWKNKAPWTRPEEIKP